MLKWALLPLSVCACVRGCVRADVCVHMGMRVGASAENKTGGRERPRSGGASLEGRGVGSPTSTPAQRASFMQAPDTMRAGAGVPGKAGTGGTVGTASLVPLLLGALPAVLPEGHPLPAC